jgi:sugar phosphate permease
LIVATLLMGLLHLSWQISLFVLAGFGVCFALVFWFLFRDRPDAHPWANEAEQQLVEEGIPVPAAGTRPRLRRDPHSRFNLGMLLLLAFASTFVDALYVFWIPLFLRQAKGLSTEEMGVYSSLPLFGGALGGLCGGFLNDLLMRRLGRRWARSTIGFTGKITAAMLLALTVLVADGRQAMLVLLVCKFFSDTNQPTIWGTITDISGRAAGTIFGLVNGTGSVAAMLAGPVIGYVKFHHGWDVVFFGLAGLYVIAAFSWLLIDCTWPVVEDRPLALPREELP